MKPGQPDILVREAVPADIECLIEFSKAMAWETEERQLEPTRLRSGIQSALTNLAHGIYWVAEVQHASRSQVVGQLLITYEWSDWRNAKFWWIQSVYVHQDWRNQGVFRALYHHVHERAQASPDVCGLRLYVEKENATALAVYGKLGLVSTPYRMLEQDFVLPTKLADSKHVP